MLPEKPALAGAFYRSASGQEPARDWLRALPAAVCKEVGSDIQKVQWRWPVSRPLVGSFGAGLFEVRTSFDGDIQEADLETARVRQREVESAS